MRKQVESLTAYLKPECQVVETATERFICTSTLVGPNVPASTEEDWDADTEVGEIQF